MTVIEPPRRTGAGAKKYKDMKKTVKEIAVFMREQADNIEQKFAGVRDFDDGLSSAQVLFLFMTLAEVLNNDIKEIAK